MLREMLSKLALVDNEQRARLAKAQNLLEREAMR